MSSYDHPIYWLDSSEVRGVHHMKAAHGRVISSHRSTSTKCGQVIFAIIFRTCFRSYMSLLFLSYIACTCLSDSSHLFVFYFNVSSSIQRLFQFLQCLNHFFPKGHFMHRTSAIFKLEFSKIRY